MKQAIDNCEVPHCLTPQCNGLVKPDIVFFGEQLPGEFHRNRSLPSEADLCIVMGTSLTVQPFASLPGFCKDGIPRVLINLERVGGLGSRADDVLLLGDCDAGVRKLAGALGWERELEALWKSTQPGLQSGSHGQGDAQTSKGEDLDDRIASLTDEVDKSLKISNDHTALLRHHLNEEQIRGAHSNRVHDRLSSSLEDISSVEAKSQTERSAPSESKVPSKTSQVDAPEVTVEKSYNSQATKIPVSGPEKPSL